MQKGRETKLSTVSTDENKDSQAALQQPTFIVAA